MAEDVWTGGYRKFMQEDKRSTLDVLNKIASGERGASVDVPAQKKLMESVRKGKDVSVAEEEKSLGNLPGKQKGEITKGAALSMIADYMDGKDVDFRTATEILSV